MCSFDCLGLLDQMVVVTVQLRTVVFLWGGLWPGHCVSILGPTFYQLSLQPQAWLTSSLSDCVVSPVPFKLPINLYQQTAHVVRILGKNKGILGKVWVPIVWVLTHQQLMLLWA